MSDQLPNLKPGERLKTIDPPPVLRKITFNVAEHGLGLLGVSLDALMNAPGIPDPVMPKPSGYEAFLEAVCENHADIDLGDLTPDEARVVVESVAAFFLFDCKMGLLDPKGTLKR